MRAVLPHLDDAVLGPGHGALDQEQVALGIVDGGAFDEPSTKQALELIEGWGQERPLLLVVTEDEETLTKSFRNLDRVVVTVPGELEVNQVVWARALLISEQALEQVQGRAQ